ncbi:MAG: DoxX family protein [Candidatus Yanofskybacteria bacterium]|nr:DoxX family protein [Candidatus Yanofskybacteria bacterium]
MTKFQKIFLFLLRLAMGWLMFYAGITKIINPSWSAEGYLKSAKTFAGLFNWFASPEILPVTNWLNEWGLTILGISLILGIFVRLTSIYGVVLMLLYYFPVLDFPYAGEHSFIIDEHIIYALVLLFFAAIRAGRVWGLENRCARLPICSKFPRLRNWLG